MELTVKVEGLDLSTADLVALRKETAFIWDAYGVLGARSGVPDQVVVTFAGDFANAVSEALRQMAGDPDPPDYDVARGEFVAVAKTIALNDEATSAHVILDASLLADSTTRFLVVAHELVHPLLNRGHALAGVKNREKQGGRSRAGDIPRELGIIMADEYRAEVISGRLLSGLADFKSVLAAQLALFNETWLAELSVALRDWPVAHRDGQLITNISDFLTTTCRYQGHADAISGSRGNPSVLEADSLKDLAGAEYMLNPLLAFLAFLRRAHPLPACDDWSATDEATQDESELAVLEVWKRIGIRLQ